MARKLRAAIEADGSLKRAAPAAPAAKPRRQVDLASGSQARRLVGADPRTRRGRSPHRPRPKRHRGGCAREPLRLEKAPAAEAVRPRPTRSPLTARRSEAGRSAPRQQSVLLGAGHGPRPAGPRPGNNPFASAQGMGQRPSPTPGNIPRPQAPRPGAPRPGLLVPVPRPGAPRGGQGGRPGAPFQQRTGGPGRPGGAGGGGAGGPGASRRWRRFRRSSRWRWRSWSWPRRWYRWCLRQGRRQEQAAQVAAGEAARVRDAEAPVVGGVNVTRGNGSSSACVAAHGSPTSRTRSRPEQLHRAARHPRHRSSSTSARWPRRPSRWTRRPSRCWVLSSATRSRWSRPKTRTRSSSRASVLDLEPGARGRGRGRPRDPSAGGHRHGPRRPR